MNQKGQNPAESAAFDTYDAIMDGAFAASSSPKRAPIEVEVQAGSDATRQATAGRTVRHAATGIETSDLLRGLTDVQMHAVTHVDGPLLVLAGPGSGKTTVVTRRVAYLVSQGIPPWQILALTFTNKAAGEMQERIAKLVPENISGRRGLTVATFHSFCARLLRRYAGAAGLNERFSIYDSGDSRDAIKLALKQANLDAKNFTPGSVAHAISGAKNQLMDAAAYSSQAGDFWTRSIAKVYANYEGILKKNDALDFDDLLLSTARLLRNNAQVRQELQNRFQYILIDEYQDTNHAQFVIAHSLAASHQNICVVGDPDQSIYKFRGADIGNILEFEKHYPKATVIPLGQNFRSTGHIVATAATLIANNRKRKQKKLHTELGDGEKPTVLTCCDEHHEAQLIAEQFRRWNAGHSPLPREGEGLGVRVQSAFDTSSPPHPSPLPQGGEGGTPWREMAVLYRINALSRVLEEAFRNANIPYVIARGTAFYERKEVKDALSYMRIVANPNDEVSLRRIVNTPTRGIGDTTLDKVEILAINNQLSLFEAMRQVSRLGGDITARAASAISKFVAMVDGWRETASGIARPGMLLTNEEEKPDLAKLVERIITESGLEALYRKSKLEEDVDRLENLNELINAAADFVPPPSDEDRDVAQGAAPTVMNALHAFLESVALVSDADAIDPANGAVTLMTMHAAKGLEFECVAIAGMEEGLLPHSRSVGNEDELEEERRLCFVGITRAKRHLWLTHSMFRTNRGLRERTMASQFLDELPQESITKMDLAGSAMYDDEEGDADWGRNSYDFSGRKNYSAKLDDAIARGGGSEGPSGDEAGYGRGKPGGSSRSIPFPVGCLVEHPKFGRGRVEVFTPRASGSSVQVMFQSVGRKTLIVEYAKLQRLE